MTVGSRAVVVRSELDFARHSTKADKIDDYVSARMRQLHIPAFRLAIVRDSRIRKRKGTGSRISSYERTQ